MGEGRGDRVAIKIKFGRRRRERERGKDSVESRRKSEGGDRKINRVDSWSNRSRYEFSLYFRISLSLSFSDLSALDSSTMR